MTLEKLAEITQHGFADIEMRLGQRMDGLEHRMGSFEDRMDRFEEKLEKLTDIVTNLAKAMHENFQHVYARLDTLREDISDLPAIREELRDLRNRVHTLERKV